MAKAVSSSCNCSYKWVLNIFRHQIFLNEYTNIFWPGLTCVKVVLCLLLAGVGQLEEAAWTDIPAESPSVFNFLNAPSINMYISSSHHSNFSHSTDWRGARARRVFYQEENYKYLDRRPHRWTVNILSNSPSGYWQTSQINRPENSLHFPTGFNQFRKFPQRGDICF